MYYVAFNHIFKDYRFLDKVSMVHFPYYLAESNASLFNEVEGNLFIRHLKKLGYKQKFELIPVENLTN